MNAGMAGQFGGMPPTGALGTPLEEKRRDNPQENPAVKDDLVGSPGPPVQSHTWPPDHTGEWQQRKILHQLERKRGE